MHATIANRKTKTTEKTALIQTTILHNNYQDVVRRINSVTTIGGYKKDVFCLSNGVFLRHFDVLERCDEYLLVKSGIAPAVRLINTRYKKTKQVKAA